MRAERRATRTCGIDEVRATAMGVGAALASVTVCAFGDGWVWRVCGEPRRAAESTHAPRSRRLGCAADERAADACSRALAEYNAVDARRRSKSECVHVCERTMDDQLGLSLCSAAGRPRRRVRARRVGARTAAAAARDSLALGHGAVEGAVLLDNLYISRETDDGISKTSVKSTVAARRASTRGASGVTPRSRAHDRQRVGRDDRSRRVVRRRPTRS